MFKKHPVTPKAMYIQEIANTACFWMKTNVTPNEDIFFDDNMLWLQRRSEAVSHTYIYMYQKTEENLSPMGARSFRC